MWSFHDIVNFLQNSDNRQPIAGPWWLATRCILWVHSMIYVLPALVIVGVVYNTMLYWFVF